MEILELNIKHFGKFLEHKVTLLPGVNIIYGGNETGKSTIHAFIRAMFFGIERSRGKAGRKDEYQLRQPWDNPAYFAGTMRVRYGGQIFRIERNFYKSEKEVHLICETSGQELSSQQRELEQLLGGMNEAAFLNTVFIPQAGCETDAGLAEELQKFMVNFQETRDGDLDVARALDSLKEKKRKLENQKKQEQELLDEKIARKELEREYVQRELEKREETDRMSRTDGSMPGEADPMSRTDGSMPGEADRVSRADGSRQDGINGWVQTDGNWPEDTAQRVEETEDRSTSGRTGRNYGGSQPEYGDEGIKSDRIKEAEGNVQENADGDTGMFRSFLLLLNFLLLLCSVLAVTGGIFAEGLVVRVVLIGLGILFTALFAMTVRYTVTSGEFFGGTGRKNDGITGNFEGTEQSGKMGYGNDRITRENDYGDIGHSDNGQGVGEPTGRTSGMSGMPEASVIQPAATAKSLLQKQLEEGRKLWKREERKKERQERQVRLEVIRSEIEELYGQRERLAVFDREMEAIDLAMLRIREISGKIYQEAGADFGRTASRILSELTEGRYCQVALDEKLQVRVNTPSRLLYLHQVSYATMNQIYFALRMAAGELLSLGQPLPILLDETFAMYDDERLEAALRWLEKSGRQVLLFTCQTREKIILDKIRRKTKC